MAIYQGALHPKAKSELQELATELGLETTGTKIDVQERIKRHLAANTELSQDERFVGLYTRKKPSKNIKEPSQQPPDPTPESDAAQNARVARRGSHRAFPGSPMKPNDIDEAAAVALPSSPVKSVIAAFNKAVASAPEGEMVKQIVGEKSRIVRAEGYKALVNSRTVLSNAKNIASLTIVAELLWIIVVFVPWAWYQVPLNAPYTTHYDGPPPAVIQPGSAPLVSSRIAHIPYPPAHFLQSSDFYSALFKWALPTLFVPQLLANFISFRPGDSWLETGEADPLTAAIVRLACVFAGEWNLDWSTVGITFKWRVLSASIAAAFALAEAIGERRSSSLVDETREEETEGEENGGSQALTVRRSTRNA